MNSTITQQPVPHIVTTSTKSVGIQALLVLIFGPFGLLYSSIKGTLVLLLGLPTIAVVAGSLSIFSANANNMVGAFGGLGLAILCIPAMYIGALIWGVCAVKAFNRDLLGA